MGYEYEEVIFEKTNCFGQRVAPNYKVLIPLVGTFVAPKPLPKPSVELSNSVLVKNSRKRMLKNKRRRKNEDI